ncbi:MAG TPA: hypothetical protein IAC04_03085 [Candidatus Coprenecus stercoravium]|uniref:Lipoprotein n=1 Tax=Candidatus Coprenecus stercoravium TaxID=2840735 RepID=A0A9D2GQA4_9BACT|nr:hypothetical protein [Candidatus Coprenecus stercoravium]
MDRIVRISLLCVASLLVLSGCIRDQILPCPPLSVSIGVLDKNWSNIGDAVGTEFDSLLHVKDDALPFREYISTICYSLKNLSTGDSAVVTARYVIEHDEQRELIVFPDSLPFGQYEITVWGNIQESALSEDFCTVTLHEDGDSEAEDIFHACDTLDYRYDAAEFNLDLQRTVGCLLIYAFHLPEGVDYSTKDIEGVYGNVGKGLQYSGPVSVHTEMDWGKDCGNVMTATCTAPSEEKAVLQLAFYDTDQSSAAGSVRLSQDGTYMAEPVSVAIRRNELTVLRYDYNPEADNFNISVLVNDMWMDIHDMIMD